MSLFANTDKVEVTLKRPYHFTAFEDYFLLKKGFKNLTNNCINLETFHSALFINPHSFHYVMALYSSHPICLTAYKNPDILLRR